MKRGLLFFIGLVVVAPVGSLLAQTNGGASRVLSLAMSDSVHLATEVFVPSDSLPRATILIRAAADRKNYKDAALSFLQHDYNVVIQSLRGRFGSEGADSLFVDPVRNFIQDAHETLRWITEQKWSDGKVATFGYHDAGYAQYMLALDPPPALKTQYIISAPFDFYQHAAFPSGVFRKELMEHWLPMLSSANYAEFWKEHARLSPFWRPFIAWRKTTRIHHPVSHVTGWFDPFKEGTIMAFRLYQKYADKFARHHQRLVIGPWTRLPEGAGREQGELIFPENAPLDILQDALRWFNQWLKAIDTGLLIEPPVKYYLMGDVKDEIAPGNIWNTAATWPPEHRRVKFYLHSDGRLIFEQRAKEEVAEGFRYDPDSPMQTLGGDNFAIERGPFDQTTNELRSDVLIFTSPPLEEPLTITGRVRVKLYASSSEYDTDFVAKLTDVYPDGRSFLIADGIVRARYRKGLQREKLLSRKKVETFWIDLGNTAMVFHTGHRIRLAITSSNSPKFEPNPNSPLPFRSHKRTRIAVNTIYYGGKKASYLELPVRIID